LLYLEVERDHGYDIGDVVHLRLPESLVPGAAYYFVYMDVQHRTLNFTAAEFGATWRRSTDALYATDFFTVADYEPTLVPVYEPTAYPAYAPTPKPTPSPTPRPTHAPTAYAPTKPCTIVFERDADWYWEVGSTVHFTVRVCDAQQRDYSYGYGYGLLDVLLYDASGVVQDAVATYVQMGGRDFVDVEYRVPDGLSPGVGYKLRGIEYTRGYDETSAPFDVSASTKFRPTRAPTPRPTHDHIDLVVKDGTRVVNLGSDEDNAVAPGASLTLTLKYTGAARSANGRVVVQLCRGPKNWRCDPAKVHSDPLGIADGANQMVVVDLSSSKAAATETFKIPADANTKDDYRFLIRDRMETADVEPYYARGNDAPHDYVQVSDTFRVSEFLPSRAPSPRPTTPRPSPAPTGTTLVFVDGPRNWIAGKRETLTLRLTGDARKTFDSDYGVVDVVLYWAEASVVGDVDYGELVQYERLERREQDFAVDVPWDLPAGSYKLVAYEYTRGLEVESAPFAVAKTPKPTVAPTPETAAPSPLPTHHGLELTVTTPRGKPLRNKNAFLVAGETVTIAASYKGADARAVAQAGLVTVGICRERDADASLDAGGCAGDKIVLEYGAAVAASAAASLTVTVPGDLSPTSEYVFYAVDLVNEWVLVTPKWEYEANAPTPEPTRRPTAATLGFEGVPGHAAPGDKVTLGVRFLDNRESAPATSHMDCLLYEWDAASTASAYVAPALVLASYVEIHDDDDALDLAFTLPKALKEAAYYVRCVDALRGLDG